MRDTRRMTNTQYPRNDKRHCFSPADIGQSDGISD